MKTKEILTKIGIIMEKWELLFYHRHEAITITIVDSATDPSFISDMKKDRDDLDMLPQMNRLVKTG